MRRMEWEADNCDGGKISERRIGEKFRDGDE
jgi:hypothetical protein